MKRITSVNVRISPEMKDELQELADRYRRKLSDYVRLVLEDHLEQQKRRDPGTYRPPRVAGLEGDES
jgi:mRNA-degrading endonuclease RelE of RelBE toxin-antitoxin system